MADDKSKRLEEQIIRFLRLQHREVSETIEEDAKAITTNFLHISQPSNQPEHKVSGVILQDAAALFATIPQENSFKVIIGDPDNENLTHYIVADKTTKNIIMSFSQASSYENVGIVGDCFINTDFISDEVMSTVPEEIRFILLAQKQQGNILETGVEPPHRKEHIYNSKVYIDRLNEDADSSTSPTAASIFCALKYPDLNPSDSSETKFKQIYREGVLYSDVLDVEKDLRLANYTRQLASEFSDINNLLRTEDSIRVNAETLPEVEAALLQNQKFQKISFPLLKKTHSFIVEFHDGDQCTIALSYAKKTKENTRINDSIYVNPETLKKLPEAIREAFDINSEEKNKLKEDRNTLKHMLTLSPLENSSAVAPIELCEASELEARIFCAQKHAYTTTEKFEADLARIYQNGKLYTNDSEVANDEKLLENAQYTAREMLITNTRNNEDRQFSLTQDDIREIESGLRRSEFTVLGDICSFKFPDSGKDHHVVTNNYGEVFLSYETALNSTTPSSTTFVNMEAINVLKEDVIKKLSQDLQKKLGIESIEPPQISETQKKPQKLGFDVSKVAGTIIQKAKDLLRKLNKKEGKDREL